MYGKCCAILRLTIDVFLTSCARACLWTAGDDGVSDRVVACSARDSFLQGSNLLGADQAQGVMDTDIDTDSGTDTDTDAKTPRH